MLTPVLFIFNMVKYKLFVEHFYNNLVSVQKLKGNFSVEMSNTMDQPISQDNYLKCVSFRKAVHLCVSRSPFLQSEKSRTCMLVRRVSMEDRPSGNKKGDGKPGGSGCPCPVRESLSMLSLAVGVESGVSSVCD